MKMLTENGERTELFKLDEEEERVGAIVRWRKDIYYLWTFLPGIASAIIIKRKLNEETAQRIISNVNKSSSAFSSESEKDWNAKVKKEYYGYPEIINEMLKGDVQLYNFMEQLSKNEELMLSHYSLFSYMAEITENNEKDIKRETKRLFKSKMSLMQKLQDFNKVWYGNVWNDMLKKNSLSEKVPLKELPIKRELSEDTRLQGVNIGGMVFSLHKRGDEYIITDNEDYSMIYQITSCDLWSLDYGMDKEKNVAEIMAAKANASSFEEEFEYMQEAYDAYEALGFQETLQGERYNGVRFKVDGRRAYADQTEYSHEYDITEYPMWVITLENGVKIDDAFPSEICKRATHGVFE